MFLAPEAYELLAKSCVLLNGQIQKPLSLNQGKRLCDIAGNSSQPAELWFESDCEAFQDLGRPVGLKWSFVALLLCFFES